MTEGSRPHDLVLEQRARARRALEEARVASDRLRRARERAERLLRMSGTEKAPRSQDRLRRRMREIESRMRATDTMMRFTERDLAALDDDAERATDGVDHRGIDGVTASERRHAPGADAGGAISPDASDDVDGIDGPVLFGPERP